MSNLGSYQTKVEDMYKAGGPEIWEALIRQDGYNDGAHDTLVKLSIPLGIGMLCTIKQLYDVGKNCYTNAKEKRQLIKNAAAEAEEKLVQFYEAELSEADNDNGGNK